MTLFQPPLPAEYYSMPEPQVLARIADRKLQLGRRLVILGHHYQADDIIRFADFIGDSFKLSKQAATEAGHAEFIVFCGVHFMAESADILAGANQQVILPDLSAGCSMADMADIDQVAEAWETLQGVCSACGTPALGRESQPGAAVPQRFGRVVPICYVNSSAAVKAFVGRNGGAACTSSNAERAIRWALGKTDAETRRHGDAGNPRIPRGSASEGSPRPRVRILFIPDQHLGRNTAFRLGHPLESMVVWDPNKPSGGLTDGQLRDATFILWKGHCSVHQLFLPEHIDKVRAEQPGIKVIVHPECPFEVVQKADLSGSTERIAAVIEAAEPGSRWAIGTEIHLVKRLADRYAGVKHVQSLSDCQCLCTTMYRIDPQHLLWVLDNLAEGRVVNRIHVDDQTKADARLALDRMLQLPP